MAAKAAAKASHVAAMWRSGDICSWAQSAVSADWRSLASHCCGKAERDNLVAAKAMTISWPRLIGGAGIERRERSRAESLQPWRRLAGENAIATFNAMTAALHGSGGS